MTDDENGQYEEEKSNFNMFDDDKKLQADISGTHANKIETLPQGKFQI